MSATSMPVRWFTKLGIADIPEVGGKNASLGELASNLGAAGVTVPSGFALTASLCREALSATNAWHVSTDCHYLHCPRSVLRKSSTDRLQPCEKKAVPGPPDL